jgi:hypothetical protein
MSGWDAWVVPPARISAVMNKRVLIFMLTGYINNILPESQISDKHLSISDGLGLAGEL